MCVERVCGGGVPSENTSIEPPWKSMIPLQMYNPGRVVEERGGVGVANRVSRTGRVRVRGVMDLIG